MPRGALALCVAFVCTTPFGAERSSAVRAEFQRQNPCPATSLTRGPCKGWIADHIAPLCFGGPDAVSNMEWITVERARVKDAEDRRLCAALRRTQ